MAQLKINHIYVAPILNILNIMMKMAETDEGGGVDNVLNIFKCW